MNTITNITHHAYDRMESRHVDPDVAILAAELGRKCAYMKYVLNFSDIPKKTLESYEPRFRKKLEKQLPVVACVDTKTNTLVTTYRVGNWRINWKKRK